MRKVAIFHDYLNQLGGAERVLSVLLEIFPQAHLYTLFYDEEKTKGYFKKWLKRTSFLDFKLVRKHHRLFIPFFSLACFFMKIKEDYDLVISSTAGYAKAFRYKKNNLKPYHIAYCHTPLRYAWEVSYLKNYRFIPFSFFLKDFLILRFLRFLKKWDQRTAQKVNVFIANSYYTAEKIRNYYQRDAVVIYPPVDFSKFYYEPDLKNSEEKDFYLMVGRVIYYKGFDLTIKAFNHLDLPLKIIGQGPELKKIKKIAKSSLIEFLGELSDEDLRSYYNRAKALIFPQIEDFGLVAAEAQACGLPVIAYRKSGACEIVEENKTGIFIDEQSPAAIEKAVVRLEKMKFNREYISLRARRFDKENFKKKLCDFLLMLGF